MTSLIMLNCCTAKAFCILRERKFLLGAIVFAILLLCIRDECQNFVVVIMQLNAAAFQSENCTFWAYVLHAISVIRNSWVWSTSWDYSIKTCLYNECVTTLYLYIYKRGALFDLPQCTPPRPLAFGGWNFDK